MLLPGRRNTILQYFILLVSWNE